MGLVSRDISVTHDGHEIAIVAALTGMRLSTAAYKLYINGKLVDKHSVSLFGMLLGTVVTLRGQLPASQPGEKARQVKAVANLRVIRRSDYQVFVLDEQIHQEWATLGGL